MARFKGEQIVILSQVKYVTEKQKRVKMGQTCHQVNRTLLKVYFTDLVLNLQVLANEVNIGYEDMSNEQASNFFLDQ